MAASSSSVNLNTEKEGKQQESDSEEGPECAVCLQTCVLPTRLPCKHVFCFLCAKGLALQSRRCAMCRADIPQEFLERPELLEAKQPKAGTSTDNTGTGSEAAALEEPPDKNYAWFYEGRNGWWQYEARLSEELEVAYQGGSRTHDALIAGSIYTLDFNNWMQSRRDDPARRRRIKRDLASCHHKGVAGLRQLASAPGVSDTSGLPPAPGGPVQQQMGVPMQVYQQPGVVNPPLRQSNQAQGMYPPPINRRGTTTRITRSSARGVAQGYVNRRSRNRSPITNIQNNSDIRRIIAAAANNAFTQGFGVGASLYGGDESSEDEEEEESPDDDSNNNGGNGQLRALLLGRGGACILINDDPIYIDSD